MSSAVLDASALLALLNSEPGSERVAQAIVARAAIGTVNLSEVIAKLNESGVPAVAVRGALDPLRLDVIDFDEALAYQAGLLGSMTRPAGLSLGDRACIALGQALGLPILTTERSWPRLLPGVLIEVIR